MNDSQAALSYGRIVVRISFAAHADGDLLVLQQSRLIRRCVEYALSEFQRQLAQALSAMQDDLGRLRHRKEQLQKELANLIAAIASTGHTPSIAEAIGERERELRTITQKLLGSSRDAVSPRLSEIRDFVIDRLTNIRALVSSDVERARVELVKHVTSITLQPQHDHYETTGDWNLPGKQPTLGDGDEMALDQKWGQTLSL